MPDKMDKALDLIAAMKAAVPFEVELTPPLITRLRAEPNGMDPTPRQIVREASYPATKAAFLPHRAG